MKQEKDRKQLLRSFFFYLFINLSNVYNNVLPRFYASPPILSSFLVSNFPNKHNPNYSLEQRIRKQHILFISKTSLVGRSLIINPFENIPLSSKEDSYVEKTSQKNYKRMQKSLT